ncbi:hypothetical protein, partial [Aquibaculum sediminis]|uniref:hypothetical protein n=1 Tax=Aquibaculum sediminis TaxID=3231907 RepID=UPI003451D5F9
PIDDPSPAIAGAGQAPAMVHLLPMNRHLHKTSRSSQSDSRSDPNRDVNRLYLFDVDRIHAFI